MTRREAREQALSMIFEMNFNDNSVDEMVDNALIFRDESVDEYAVQIAQHWEDNLSAVEQYSKKWKANRLPKVSLAILMLAITEIAYVKDAPVGAVINEAVELAKKYAGPEDASYINGVLGGYVRGTMGEAALPKEAEE